MLGTASPPEICDVGLEIMKEIPFAYRDWTYDYQAEAQFPWLKVLNSGMAGEIVSMLLILFIPLLNSSTTKIIAVSLLGAIAVASVAVTVVASSRTRNTTMCCTRCKKEMDYQEVDYPADCVKGNHSDVIKGDNDRVYCFAGGKGGGWMRLMQGVRTCEQCKRFVVVRPLVNKRIAGGRSEVLHYDLGLKRTQRAIRRLSKKATTEK